MKKKIWLCIVLLILSNIQNTTASQQNGVSTIITSFSNNILLSTDDSNYPHHVETTLAISENGTLFAGWKNALTHYGAGQRVSFTRSTDNGKTWSEPFDMPHFGGMDTLQSDPWLFWRNGVLYYAYLDYMGYYGADFSQITVATSRDYGQTWAPVTASNNVGLADKETMTVSKDGTVYVAYADFNLTNGDFEGVNLRLSSSTDGGSTFSEKSVIAKDDGGFVFVTTDNNNSNVHVAFVRLTEGDWGDVYHSSSSDNGLTFSEMADINQESENATIDSGSDLSRVTMPVIRFDQNDRLYSLWAGRYEPEGEWDVYIRYSDDYGQEWGQRYRVNPLINGSQWHPDMDFDSQGRVHVVYYDQQGDSYRPYYRMITFPKDPSAEPEFGDTIAIASENTSAPYNRRPGEYFAIRFDSSDIPHVVWSDGREQEMDIYYSQGIPSQVPGTSSSQASGTTSSTSSQTTETSSSARIDFLFVLPFSFVILALRKNRKKKER